MHAMKYTMRHRESNQLSVGTVFCAFMEMMGQSGSQIKHHKYTKTNTRLQTYFYTKTV